MKIKQLLLPLAFCFTLFISQHATAEELKTIILKDGSVLKGKIISMSDGTYTIQTPTINSLEIKEDAIANISSSENSNLENSGLQSQVEEIQNQVLQDPAIMADIQRMLEDPAMLELMQDPDFINDIMSMDPVRIQNNPKAQHTELWHLPHLATCR